MTSMPRYARGIRAAPMRFLDFFALAIVIAAILRGIWVGLLRSALSLASLAAALCAVWVWDEPFAHWLQNPRGLSVRYDHAPWTAGLLLFAGVYAAVAMFGHVMRQGARELGRGRLDRLGGAVLGTGVGVLAAGLLLFMIVSPVGRDHPIVAGSGFLALVDGAEEAAEALAQHQPDVAAGTSSDARPRDSGGIRWSGWEVVT